MSTLLSDVRTLTRDFISNYSTGTTKDEVIDRAINRAVERIKRNVAIPSDEDIYSFWYTQDKLFYNLPSTFREALHVAYNNRDSNRQSNKWDYFDYLHVLQGAGGARQNRWSITHINGKKQLVMVGYNGYQGSTLITMDALTSPTATASDDASGLAVDTITKVEGTGSLAFDITDSAGTATITFTGLTLDLEDLFDKHGFLKMHCYMTDADIDDVTIKLQSSSGNLYTIVATLNDDGVDFVADEWQKIAWHTDEKVPTGTPDLSAITTVVLEFGLGSTFTSATDFRIDNLFSAYAEKMDLVHYTNTKGTSSAGATLTTLSDPDDVLWYSADYDEYTDVIAQQAALILWPHVRGDKEQFMILKQEFRENLKSFARANPRKRVQGQFKHSLKR